MVALMGDQRGAGCVDTPAERRAALIAFLGAGMPSAPSKALMVEALAGARRAVAMYQAPGPAVDDWLAGELRLRVIREVLPAWRGGTCSRRPPEKLPRPTPSHTPTPPT